MNAIAVANCLRGSKVRVFEKYMFTNLTHRQAMAFAEELRGFAMRMRETWTDSEWDTLRRSSPYVCRFERAKEIILELSHWYEVVGSLGFGVEARL
jgi:hypothetical protein